MYLIDESKKNKITKQNNYEETRGEVYYGYVVGCTRLKELEQKTEKKRKDHKEKSIGKSAPGSSVPQQVSRRGYSPLPSQGEKYRKECCRFNRTFDTDICTLMHSLTRIYQP